MREIEKIYSRLVRVIGKVKGSFSLVTLLLKIFFHAQNPFK